MVKKPEFLWPGLTLIFNFFRVFWPEKTRNFKVRPDLTLTRPSGSGFFRLLTRKPDLKALLSTLFYIDHAIVGRESMYCRGGACGPYSICIMWPNQYFFKNILLFRESLKNHLRIFRESLENLEKVSRESLENVPRRDWWLLLSSLEGKSWRQGRKARHVGKAWRQSMKVSQLAKDRYQL